VPRARDEAPAGIVELSRSVVQQINGARARVGDERVLLLSSPLPQGAAPCRAPRRRRAACSSGRLTDHPVSHAARRFFSKMLYNDVRHLEFLPRVLHEDSACDGWALDRLQ
jgi:hypothetical protein